MLSSIDHYVCAVSSVAAATEGMRKAGFHVVPGGVHPIGTENALVPFADGAYMELVGFREPNASHRWWEKLQRGGGIVDVCCQTGDTAADVSTFRKAGIPYTDARSLGRTRPDGFQLSFSVANPSEDVGVVTFLVQDVTPRSERVPQETTHTNGVTGLQRVIIATDNAARIGKLYGDALGKPRRAIQRPDLGAEGVEITIGGAHRLEYLAPTGAGAIADWLKQRGPSPYAAVLTSNGQTGPLAVEGLNGARLILARRD